MFKNLFGEKKPAPASSPALAKRDVAQAALVEQVRRRFLWLRRKSNFLLLHRLVDIEIECVVSNENVQCAGSCHVPTVVG